MASTSKAPIPLESHLPIGCNVCEKKFATESNKRRHMRNAHKIAVESEFKLKCSECLNIFRSHSSFMSHLTESHRDISIQKEVLEFPDVNSFELWKMHMEEQTASKYLLKTQYKRTNGKIIMYYNCHRSGKFTSHSKGVRRLKVGGSCKINGYCPARIKTEVATEVQDNSKIAVEYCSTHIGHVCDIGFLRLSKSEKDDIAGKLLTGVPFSHIMSCVAENASPTKRLAVTKVQDLRNIAASYGIDRSTIRNANDVIVDNDVSVDSWVKEMMSSDSSPILLYNASFESSEKYPNLKDELTRGELTKRLTTLRKSHKVAEAAVHEIQVIPERENTWLVPSLTSVGELYKVKRYKMESSHACNLRCEQCNSCIHQFQCSCVDSAVNYNFCKHIHILCLKIGSDELLAEIPSDDYPSDDYPIASDGDDNLEISNTHLEEKARGGNATAVEIKKESSNLEKLREDAKTAVSGLYSLIENYEKEETLQKMIELLTSLKHTWETIESQDNQLD